MQNPELFIAKFSRLKEVLDKLNENKIDWMISGSGCLWFYGNKREPQDIDIFLRDSQHDLADKVFGIKSFEYTSSLEKVRNSNPSGSHDYQLTSHLRITADNKTYDLSMGNSVFNKRTNIQSSIGPIWLIPPEDALLIKALLQRGPDVGKQDLEDIQNFLKIYTPDLDYLESRIKEIGAEGRVRDIFDID